MGEDKSIIRLSSAEEAALTSALIAATIDVLPTEGQGRRRGPLEGDDAVVLDFPRRTFVTKGGVFLKSAEQVATYLNSDEVDDRTEAYIRVILQGGKKITPAHLHHIYRKQRWSWTFLTYGELHRRRKIWAKEDAQREALARPKGTAVIASLGAVSPPPEDLDAKLNTLLAHINTRLGELEEGLHGRLEEVKARLDALKGAAAAWFTQAQARADRKSGALPDPDQPALPGVPPPPLCSVVRSATLSRIIRLAEAAASEPKQAALVLRELLGKFRVRRKYTQDPRVVLLAAHLAFRACGEDGFLEELSQLSDKVKSSAWVDRLDGAIKKLSNQIPNVPSFLQMVDKVSTIIGVRKRRIKQAN